MRRGLKLGLGAAAVLIGLPFAVLAARPPIAPSHVVSTAQEPHPEIRAAIRALKNAREHLQKAAHDFGGHRVDAIAAIDKAIEQLNIALKYDK
ncbi:MAG TPA: hypothetical protein VMG41_15800 [Gemmatimonadales bacterium]|nr:hypothetical protein [Gemmatimonadales bacterium]